MIARNISSTAPGAWGHGLARRRHSFLPAGIEGIGAGLAGLTRQTARVIRRAVTVRVAPLSDRTRPAVAAAVDVGLERIAHAVVAGRRRALTGDAACTFAVARSRAMREARTHAAAATAIDIGLVTVDDPVAAR